MTAVTVHEELDLEVHFAAHITARAAGLKIPDRYDTYVGGTDDEAADHFTVVMANLRAMGVRYTPIRDGYRFGVEFDNGVLFRSVHIREEVVAAHLAEVSR